MTRVVEQSINEREFILQALRAGVRLDSRTLEQYRDLSVQFGDEYGVADVRLGRTRVVVRISCTVTTPYPERKFDGIFTISCELSPMVSPSFEAGRQSTDEVILARILDKAIRRSSALDTESLCIVAGLQVFHLRADVNVLEHDGNIVDTSCIALVAALQHFRRPDVSVEGENVTVYGPREREPVPLSMLHQPLCLTVSYYDGGKVALLDATAAEEGVREGEVVITLNRHGEICQIAKYGGPAVDALAMLNWVHIAVVKVQELSNTIQKALEEDAKKRDAGGLMAELSAENDR